MTQMKPKAATTTSALVNWRDAGLDEEQLDQVTGGIAITKKIDASSPLLFLNCANGAHI